MPDPSPFDKTTQYTAMKKLFLVDAYALIFKYYYAFLGRPMRNRTGMNTSVVFGFVKFLRDIQKRERPDLLGVAFDPPGGSFRREIFPEYKANRTETPEDILLSVPYVKRVLEAMCIPILEVEGYEADDVIGTLSQKGAEAGYDVYMVTPDKDYGQLVRDRCRIYKQRGADGSIEIVGREEIREKYGVDDPQLVRDILALWGDASDNIAAAYNALLHEQRGWDGYCTGDDLRAVAGMEIAEIARALFPQLSEQEGLALTMSCMSYENEYLSRHGGVLYPDVEEVLAQLSAKHPLMIVTNAADGYVDAMFSAHRLGKYFTDHETHGRTGLSKGENISLIMSRNGIQDAWYVGDTLKDQLACEAAGVPFVYAAYGFGEAQRWQARISCFRDLLTLFD